MEVFEGRIKSDGKEGGDSTVINEKICTVALMRHGGSHLIRPIVDMMGFKIIEPGNFDAPMDEAQGPVIVWLRDPRDRMVSTLRWWRQHGAKKEAILNRVGDNDDERLAWMLSERFLREMKAWAEIWTVWPGALKIRFEDMCNRDRGPEEVEMIAEHLEVRCDPQMVFDRTFEKGRTFTGRYSDWQEVFGPKANEAWNYKGKGPRLLELMGYSS